MTVQIVNICKFLVQFLS